MGIHPKYALSICAGVGAFDLGLELAFPESVTACFIEREVAAIEILVARMEEGSLTPAPIHSNLLTFDGRPWRGIIHTVIAGLPCQPYSIAGKQLGHDDERAIWPAFIRVVGEVQPEVVFLENVPAFLGFFRPVGDELQRMGYNVEEPLLLTASECGASHRRERFFAMAYRSRRGLRELRKSSGRNGLPDWCQQAMADAARDVGTRPDRETRGRRGVRKTSDAVGNPEQPRTNTFAAHGGSRKAIGESGGSLADDERSRCDGSAGQELHVCRRPLQATRSGDDGGPVADTDGRRFTFSGGDAEQGSRSGSHADSLSETVADTGNGLLPEPGRGPEGRDGARSADPLLADPECSGAQCEHEPRGAGRRGTESARDSAPVADTNSLGAERESGIVRSTAADGENERPERQRDGRAARHDSDNLADAERSQRRPDLECDGSAGGRIEAAGGSRSAGESLGNADDPGLEGRIERGCGLPDQRIAGTAGDPDGLPLFAPGPGAVELWQRILRDYPWLAPAISTEEAQRILRRIPSGAAPELDFEDRTDRLRCLGNLAQSLQVATALTLLVKEACARANHIE